MGFKFMFNKTTEQIIKDAGINDGALLFAAKTAQFFMNEYVPMNTGALAGNTRLFIRNGRGVVNYIQPYASCCYYGDKKNFSRDKHEKATAYWDKAMCLTHKNELVRYVNGFIRKGRDNPK